MTQDFHKAFAIKLLVVSVAAAAIWYTAVGPMVARLGDLRDDEKAQLSEIKQGETAIGAQAESLNASLERMSRVRDELVGQLRLGQTTNVHKDLQDAAEKRGLTVSRIEPLRTTINKKTNIAGEDAILLESKEFRIECLGDFGGIAEYVNDLMSTGSDIAKITGFRLTPVSGTDARMVMQVTLYQLTKAPAILTRDTDPKSAQLTQAGDEDAEL